MVGNGGSDSDTTRDAESRDALGGSGKVTFLRQPYLDLSILVVFAISKGNSKQRPTEYVSLWRILWGRGDSLDVTLYDGSMFGILSRALLANQILNSIRIRTLYVRKIGNVELGSTSNNQFVGYVSQHVSSRLGLFQISGYALWMKTK